MGRVLSTTTGSLSILHLVVQITLVMNCIPQIGLKWDKEGVEVQMAVQYSKLPCSLAKAMTLADGSKIFTAI